MSRPRTWSDDAIRAAHAQHRTLAAASASLGMSPMGYRLRALGLGLDGWQRHHREARPATSPPTLRERRILAAASTLGTAGAARALRLTPTWIRAVVRRFRQPAAAE